MSFQDPATHARARLQTGFRYEAARRQLAQTMHERTEWHGVRRDESAAPAAVTARRALIAQALPLYDGLARYVHRHLEETIDRGETGPAGVAEEDVVLATYLTALDAAESAPHGGGLYPWMRRIARQELRTAVSQRADIETTERSLDEIVPTKEDEDWPEEMLRVIDVLAAPDALIPEAALEHDQTRRALDRLLGRLPERWREVFLLSAVDGWHDGEIARAEGLRVGDVQPIVIASRAFLREWLRSAAEIGAI